MENFQNSFSHSKDTSFSKFCVSFAQEIMANFTKVDYPHFWIIHFTFLQIS
jgi:hypothetical protein